MTCTVCGLHLGICVVVILHAVWSTIIVTQSSDAPVCVLLMHMLWLQGHDLVLEQPHPVLDHSGGSGRALRAHKGALRQPSSGECGKHSIPWNLLV
jgi:hypothetical protein